MKKQNKTAYRISRRKLNNQGSTLLTVIICIAFISILGSMMISLAMTNLQMKMIESKSKVNFYSCETIMEKIRGAVQEVASKAVEDVYENDVLSNYAYYLQKNETDRNKEIQQKAIARFMVMIKKEASAVNAYASYDDADYSDIIHDVPSGGYETDGNYFIAKNYLTSEEVSSVTITWPQLFYEEVNEADGTIKYTIRMKAVEIRYVEGDYRTAISSDIIVTMPQFSFNKGSEEVHYSMVQPYKQYILMADGTITSDHSFGTTQIQGNVYSGSGILINGNHLVNMDGKIITTRGNLTVSDAAGLKIGNSSQPLIWADNLVTSTSNAYASSGSSNPTILNINGINIIKDDLTLEGQNSSVKLTGAYIGYTGLHTVKGSSMIINGSGSSLDLSGLVNLVLAGRAHVSVQDLAKDSDILTGESIAIKSNQRAYLLPAAYITNVKHNPVTQEDYSASLPTVSINDTVDDIKYHKYVAATPYKIAAKKTGDSFLRYYYLNFACGWKADSFFREYFSRYKDTLNSMDPFNIVKVTLPTSGTVSAVGNLMSYDPANGGLGLTLGMSSEASYSGDLDTVYTPEQEAAIDASLDTAIAGISLSDPIYDSTLADDKTVGALDDILNVSLKTVASTLKVGGVNYIITKNLTLKNTGVFDYYTHTGNVEFKGSDAAKQTFWVIDGDAAINQPDDPALHACFNGIIIATGKITVCDNAAINGILISTGENGSGDVTVGNNVSLNGRIITTGNIALGQSCSLSTSDTIDTGFDNLIFNPEADILSYIFKNTDVSVNFTITNPAPNTVDLTNMISYENWKKIE